MRGLLSTKLWDERGAAALEFAFVLPVLFLIATGLIDFGRAIWTQSTLDYAVQAAARCGAVNTSTCSDATTIKTYAVSQTYGITVSNSNFTVTTAGTPCNGFAGVKVQVTYAFTYILPALRSDSGNFGATACYPT